MTGLPLSWIKYALQQCNDDPHNALKYLRENHGNSIITDVV